MNVFPPVFNPQHSEHAEYAPVLNWLTNGKGFMVLGGTHYLAELKAARSYLAIVTELSKKGRVRKLIPAVVDKHEEEVNTILKGSRCNDCHLIAIIRASGCRLICSNDKRADKHLKNQKCYLPGQRVPHIYRKKIHRRLLCDRNIIRVAQSLK